MSCGWDKTVKVRFQFLVRTSSLLFDMMYSKIYLLLQRARPMRQYFSTKISDHLHSFASYTLHSLVLTHFTRFGNSQNSNWRPTIMVTPATSIPSLFLQMVRLPPRVVRTESQCCGTWTKANTFTRSRPAMLSMRWCSRLIGTGCVRLPPVVLKSSI